jgi:hypothetical protein
MLVWCLMVRKGQKSVRMRPAKVIMNKRKSLLVVFYLLFHLVCLIWPLKEATSQSNTCNGMKK